MDKPICVWETGLSPGSRGEGSTTLHLLTNLKITHNLPFTISIWIQGILQRHPQQFNFSREYN